MLTDMKELLKQAKENNQAIFQFNINNLEWTKYILETAQKYNSPVILGVTPSAIEYMGGTTTVINIVVGLMIDLKIKIPVVLHLDHGKTFEECKEAIDCGFTSVMIDASDKNFEENITLTSKVVDYASKYNVSIEAEVGVLGDVYSNADDYKLFVASTGIDALAPSIGNKHGIYTIDPNFDYDKVKKISEESNVPLVLHGGSGISDYTLKKLVESGITKININTALQQEWTKGIRDYLDKNQDEYDPRNIISSGKENMIKYISDKFTLFNSK